MKKIYVFLFIILVSSCEKESDNVIPANINDVLPSETLKIENIFND